VRPITHGEWPVVDKPIFVDVQRELVYFSAKKDTPLEVHLYVASFAENANPDEIMRLTESGYSHCVMMDEKRERFLDWFSNIHEKPKCSVRYLEFPNETEGTIEWPRHMFPTVSWRMGVYVNSCGEIERSETRVESPVVTAEVVIEQSDPSAANTDVTTVASESPPASPPVPPPAPPPILPTTFDIPIERAVPRA